jgi:hypothetical protein
MGGEANKSSNLPHQRSYAFCFSCTFRMPGLEPRLISEAHRCRARFARIDRARLQQHVFAETINEDPQRSNPAIRLVVGGN